MATYKEPVRNYDLLSAIMLCLGGADGKYYDGVLKLLVSEVQTMCNLSQGVEKKGHIKGRTESIRNLMVSMDWSMEQAMKALRVPEPERSKYAALLQQQ